MTSKRQMKHGYLLPDEIETENTVCYQVTIPDTNEYRLALYGAITELTKWWSWEKSYQPGDTRAKTCAELWRKVLQITEGCNDMSLDDLKYRDNPADNCEVQYSTDGGITWSTMFRKDNCYSPQPLDLGDVEITINDVNTQNTNYYDNSQDISIIFPKWEYVAENQLSNMVMCYITRKFVDLICDGVVQQIQHHNDEVRSQVSWLEDFNEEFATLAIGVMAEFGVTLPAAAASAVVWSLLKCSEEIWLAIFGKSSEAYENTEARQHIACIIYYAIKDDVPLFSKWSTALDDYSNMEGDAYDIYEVVKPALSDVDVFINFMRLMESLNDVAEYLDVCPCPDTWIHVWDFAGMGMEAWTIGSNGEHVDGQGVVGTFHQFANNYKTMQILHLLLNETIPRCTTIQMDLICDRGSWGPSLVDSLQLVFPPVPTENFNSGWFLDGRTSYTWTISATPVTLTKIEIGFIRSSYTEGSNLGGVTVKEIELRGHGPDPFWGRNTD